jgi:hypothetical protein
MDPQRFDLLSTASAGRLTRRRRPEELPAVVHAISLDPSTEAAIGSLRVRPETIRGRF